MRFVRRIDDPYFRYTPNTAEGMLPVADGYEITPEQLPSRIEVAVQSRTVNQILALCDQAAMLSLGAVDCSGLDRALTRPAVPIPGGGGSFFLADENLTEGDRARLDAVIGPPVPSPATR